MTETDNALRMAWSLAAAIEQARQTGFRKLADRLEHTVLEFLDELVPTSSPTDNVTNQFALVRQKVSNRNRKVQ